MIYVLAIGLIIAIAIIVWFFFMAPLGRQRHDRELEMIRRKLERLEAQRQSTNNRTGHCGEQRDRGT